MAINLTIKNLETITYRTDCLSEDSRDRHHIRKNAVRLPSPYRYYIKPGYQEMSSICNTVGTFPDGSKAVFDIGFNPRGELPDGYTNVDYANNPDNPIICNKLVMFGEYSEFDYSYNELKFDIPIILIPELTEMGQDFWYKGYVTYMIQEGYNPSGIYITCNNLYTVSRYPASYDMNGIYISGILHTPNGESEINTRINRLKFIDIPDTGNKENLQPGDDVRIGINSAAYQMSGLDYNMFDKRGLRSIISAREDLLMRFAATERAWTSSGLRNDLIASTWHGMVALPGECLDFQVFRNGRCYHARLGDPIGVGGYQTAYGCLTCMIIPFQSEFEYHAAYASIFQWGSREIEWINQHIKDHE